VILDTSVVIAILLEEPGHELYALKIARARVNRMSGPSYLECSIVLSRSSAVSADDLDEFLEGSDIEIVAFSARHAKLARRAYLRYGRGYHKAGLNFGDCMSYALAVDFGESLLYKGDDFSKTDVISALQQR
jgi:ribonuclease VapC